MFFTVFVLFGLRLFKPKTEGQATLAEKFTAKLETSNQLPNNILIRLVLVR